MEESPGMGRLRENSPLRPSEERSDEESFILSALYKERFLASLEMTKPKTFIRSLLEAEGGDKQEETFPAGRTS